MAHLEADLRWIELAGGRLADMQRDVDGVLAAGPAMSEDVVLRGRGLQHSYGAEPVLRGVDLAVQPRGGRRADGPVGVGQVDPAALPGRSLRPMRARSSCSAAASTTCPSGSARGCGSRISGSCSSSATWCPS